MVTQDEDSERIGIARLEFDKPGGTRGNATSVAFAKRMFVIAWNEGGTPADQKLDPENLAPEDEQYFTDLFADPKNTIYVAKLDGTLAGIAWTDQWEGMPWVAMVGVDGGHQGRGIARRMMAKIVADSKAAGAKAVGLNVFDGNRRAVSLYESLGFRERSSRILETGGAHVRMELDLTQETPAAEPNTNPTVTDRRRHSPDSQPSRSARQTPRRSGARRTPPT